MRPLSAKKQYERFLLDTFLASARIDAEVVDDKGEAPDVVVRVGQDCVGVEFTELFNDNSDRDESLPLQARESLVQRIVARASEIYRASGAPFAHVSVHFNLDSSLRELNRDETARRLAAFVAAHALSPGQHVQWRPDYITSPLPALIHLVNMLGVPEPGMAHWSSPSAGWVAPMTREILQVRVDEKAALLAKYRERVGTNWLVLVSDGARPSQFFDPPTKEHASAVASPFDRTFYFARFKSLVIELGTPNDATPTLER
jgi:hypothetical protein